MLIINFVSVLELNLKQWNKKHKQKMHKKSVNLHISKQKQ